MESRTEKILRSIIDDTQYSEAAQSRVEKILLAIKNDTQYSEPAQSRIEAILLAIKNDTQYSEPAQSRIEEILLAKLNGTEYNQQPRSRIEELLIEWIDAGGVIEGIPPLTYKTVEGALNNYRIYGNTVDGESVGEFVTEGEHAGEYRVPVTVIGKNLFNETVVADKAIETEYTNAQIYHQDGKLYMNGSTTTSQADFEIAFLTTVNAEALEYINKNFGSYYFSSACPGNIQIRYTIEGSSNWRYSTNVYTSTPSRTANRIVFRLQKDYQYNHEQMGIQIERGNGVTSYEPYHEPITTNLYLPRPLRMTEDKADYIDFKEQKQYFADGTSISVNLPTIFASVGMNTICIETNVVPSGVRIKGKFKKITTTYVQSIEPDNTNNKIIFVVRAYLSKNDRMVRTGLVATNDPAIGVNINVNSTVITSGCKVFVKELAGVTPNINNTKYTWTKTKVTDGEIWYVRSYAEYINSDNEQLIIYSDAAKASLDGIIKTYTII